MNDEEFLNYCEAHSKTPRCGFTAENLARLWRIAGREDFALTWDRAQRRVYDCTEDAIMKIVDLGRRRLSQEDLT